MPGHRGDAAFLAMVAQRALMLPGIVSAVGNPITAGLLPRFRGAPEAVLAATGKDGLFRATALATPTPSAAQPAPVGAAAFGLLEQRPIAWNRCAVPPIGHKLLRGCG